MIKNMLDLLRSGKCLMEIAPEEILAIRQHNKTTAGDYEMLQREIERRLTAPKVISDRTVLK